MAPRVRKNEFKMSLQARPICASLFIRSTGGVDLRVWPGEERAPLVVCMADCNSEKEMWQRSQLSVELGMIPLDC